MAGRGGTGQRGLFLHQLVNLLVIPTFQIFVCFFLKGVTVPILPRIKLHTAQAHKWKTDSHLCSCEVHTKPRTQARDSVQPLEGLSSPQIGFKEKCFALLLGMLLRRRMRHVHFLKKHRKVYAENHNQRKPCENPRGAGRREGKGGGVTFRSRKEQRHKGRALCLAGGATARQVQNPKHQMRSKGFPRLRRRDRSVRLEFQGTVPR